MDPCFGNEDVSVEAADNKVKISIKLESDPVGASVRSSYHNNGQGGVGGVLAPCSHRLRALVTLVGHYRAEGALVATNGGFFCPVHSCSLSVSATWYTV